MKSNVCSLMCCSATRDKGPDQSGLAVRRQRGASAWGIHNSQPHSRRHWLLSRAAFLLGCDAAKQAVFIRAVGATPTTFLQERSWKEFFLGLAFKARCAVMWCVRHSKCNSCLMNCKAGFVF